jgi:predicted metal-dependent phosphoesterase TrpH
MASAERRIQAEIHTHSTSSDGEFDPDEVAQLCADADVELWSLTDHDTCAGCAAAAEAAEAHGIRFVPGIELSAYDESSVHVLGYGVDPESDEIAGLSDKLLAARRERMKQMVDELEAFGIDVSFEDVEQRADGAVARPHLARTLDAQDHVDTVQEAFDEYIENGGPAYVPITWPSVEEAIELIHAAGGVTVLAHPGRYDMDDKIPAWVDAGLEGIEVRHPSHDEQDAKRYLEIADTHGLFTTESSDFHGKDHDSWEYFGDTRLDPSRISPIIELLES